MRSVLHTPKALDEEFILAYGKLFLLYELGTSLCITTHDQHNYILFYVIGGAVFVRWRKLFLWLGVGFNIGLLFFFKYFNFVSDNISLLFSFIGIKMSIPSFRYLLPVGISFYIFQAVGYMIDVYKGDVKPEKNFVTFALFVSFFPQLVAGPIERSRRLLPQLKSFHLFNEELAMSGLRMMVWGYFLKLVLADRCAIYVDSIFDHVAMQNGGSFLVASLLFPLQIYGDFAGYSLIAIGAAKVMGINLMQNFRRPYFACTIGDFWHRWHISLSTWFKDYVYILLGGNRVSKYRCYYNLMVTFFLSGIWHGANWTFLCWGGYHGALLCIEKAIGIKNEEIKGRSRVWHWFITLLLVILGWIIFRAHSMKDAIIVISGIFSDFGAPKMEPAIFLAILMALLILIVKEILEEFCPDSLTKLTENRFAGCTYVILMISYILLFGVFGGDQFIYFQF